jgi:hypothetical protein
MTESQIEKKIVQALEFMGCMVVRIQGRGVNGVPDLIVHHDTLTAYLEDKTPRGRLSAHQVQFRADAEAHGIRVLTARSVEEAVTTVSEWFGIPCPPVASTPPGSARPRSAKGRSRSTILRN